MESAVNSLVRYFVHHEIISENDIEIYVYGVDLLLYTVLSISALLLIGAMLGFLAPAAFWLVPFSLLQGFGGGFHANTHLRCFITMAMGEVGAILLWHLLPANACLVIGILSLTAIFILCPIEHPNAPLSANTRRRMKKATCICATFIFVLGTMMSIFGFHVGDMLFLGLLTSAVSMGSATGIRFAKSAQIVHDQPSSNASEELGFRKS